MTEFLDVLNEKGEKTGQIKSRFEVHRDGDWHRLARVWVVNDQNEILLQRRSLEKASYPGRLDASVGGHLQAGDDLIHGAIREAAEEIGLEISAKDLESFFEYRISEETRPGLLDNSFVSCFLVRTKKKLEDFRMVDGEVIELKFVPLSEFRRLVAEEYESLTPRKDEFLAVIEKLERDKTGLKK